MPAMTSPAFFLAIGTSYPLLFFLLLLLLLLLSAAPLQQVVTTHGRTADTASQDCRGDPFWGGGYTATSS